VIKLARAMRRSQVSNSVSLGKGAVRVPLQYSEEFKEFFEKNKINYKITKILCY
jgi:hypothetical protein